MRNPLLILLLLLSTLLPFASAKPNKANVEENATHWLLEPTPEHKKQVHLYVGMSADKTREELQKPYRIKKGKKKNLGTDTWTYRREFPGPLVTRTVVSNNSTQVIRQNSLIVETIRITMVDDKIATVKIDRRQNTIKQEELPFRPK